MDESFIIDKNLCEHGELEGVHKQFSRGKKDRPLAIKIKKASKSKEFPEKVSGHETKEGD